MIYTDEGILFSCNQEGRIAKVHYNGTKISSKQLNDKLFAELFQSDNIQKALEFLVKIKEDSASFGWEFFLQREISIEPFYFSGALIAEEYFIFGSRSKVNFNKFVTGMMLLNNEQINRIRFLEKAKSKSEKKKEINSELFDELSRLNNELVEIQRELSKKNAELLRLNELKNNFIGMAAHDLRNPLGNIINYTEFLEEDKDTFSAEQIEFLTHIKSQSSFMLNLVNELLDVSSIEAGKVNLNLEQTDIVSLIARIIDLNKALADKKQMSVIFNTEFESLSISLDKQKMMQVITNLLTNAIKYSEKQTIITINVSRSENNILISVNDQGQGIPEDELNDLFKPFQKTSAKTTGGEKSVGLGLYIVKRIVEAHKGNIWAESKVGKGSTFFVSFPYKS